MKVLEKPNGFDEKAFSDKAERLYEEQYKDELEIQYKGKIVAIEPESGDYFIGDSVLQAGMQGKIKYPDRFFHFIRIGYKGVYKRR